MPSVGSSPVRPDGRSKVTGHARYVDDLAIEGLWHGATVRSTRPHARLIEVDASAAVAADPEVVVVTAADLPDRNVVKVIAEDWPVLAASEVNHVAEAVALVAAPTRARAKAAARRVRVVEEDLPAVTTLAAALELDDPIVLSSCNVEHGDVERVFAEAELVVTGEYSTGHQEHVYIEPQGMICIPQADGAIELIGSLQCPYYVHGALTWLFDLPSEKVRVRQAVTGGGFGGKEDFPDMIGAHAALLARKAGRPVKLVYDRHEDLVATTKRHPSYTTHRTAVAADGRLLAIDIDLALDGGAYTTLSPVVLSRAVLHAAGPYRCENVRVRGRVLATNTATNGAFRGFGAPQSQFAAERHMDRIARAVGTDPLTLRELNAYRPGDVTPTGQRLEESVSALECLRIAEERTDFRRRWRAAEEARAAAAKKGEVSCKGIGLALAWHGTGFTGEGEHRMRSPVELRIASGGRVEVLVSSTDFGQGTEIVLKQIVADAVGLDPDRVDVVAADTSVVPDSGPTVASRTVMVVGGTLERAGQRLRRELSLSGGPGDAADQIERHFAEQGPLSIVERYEPPSGSSFDETTYRGEAYAVYGWAADVVEVEIDPDTLVTHPRRATFICDVGRAIHPTLCKGQVEGGGLQAIAWGYLEEIRLDDGRFLNDTLSTCLIPTILDAPDMETVLIENPGPIGPGGAKGVGEIPMDAGAPAIVAAIENATGIAAVDIPATPERLLADRRRGRIVDDALEVDA